MMTDVYMLSIVVVTDLWCYWLAVSVLELHREVGCIRDSNLKLHPLCQIVEDIFRLGLLRRKYLETRLLNTDTAWHDIENETRKTVTTTLIHKQL